MNETFNKHKTATDVYTVLANRLCFRAWIERLNYMAIQGTPDLETLQSFMFHYGDEKNIMQFTGLYDKNGVRIYEGDRVSDHIGFGYIEYYHAGFRVNYNNGSCKWLSDYLKREFETLEVIGNIHENKDAV